MHDHSGHSHGLAIDIHAHFFGQSYLDLFNEQSAKYATEYRSTTDGWYFKSPIAAITLLLESIMWLFVTLALFLDTGEVNWIYVVITAIVITTSIRAAEATLKLIGRFAPEAKEEG